MTNSVNHHSADYRLAPAVISQRDGILRADDFDDLYFSKSGGLAEKRYVFIQANHLEERFRRSKKVTVLEFGFGLGLNLLSTMESHSSVGSDCVLDYVAFEKHPLTKDQMRECLTAAVGIHVHADSIINNLNHYLLFF